MDSNTVHLFITLFTLQDTHRNCLTFKNIFYNTQQAFCYTNQSNFPFVPNLNFLTAYSRKKNLKFNFYVSQFFLSVKGSTTDTTKGETK